MPTAPFLIPGYGAQGASASDASEPLILDNSHPGLRNFGLINSSRGILFPEKSYLAKDVEEWQTIILSELNRTNNELINI